MTAREMFEELGFNLWVERSTGTVCYEKKIPDVPGEDAHDQEINVEFELNSRTYGVWYQYSDCLGVHIEDYPNVTVQLHNAITQQMKELGWF